MKIEKFFTRRTLAIIAIIEAIIILLLGSYILQIERLGIIEKKVKAQGQETIDADIAACRALPVNMRAECAEKIGVKISTLFESNQDRIRECMKFRPLLVRFCQKGLIIIPSPTPIPSP